MKPALEFVDLCEFTGHKDPTASLVDLHVGHGLRLHEEPLVVLFDRVAQESVLDQAL